MEPVTVACINVGDKYGPEYVTRLQAAVARSLTIPHRFVCFTDNPSVTAEYMQTARPFSIRTPTCEYPGWWQKVGLFSPHVLPPGPMIYFDIDTVLVGNIDWLAEYLTADFAAIENWGSRTHEGPLYEDEISSAVMVTNGSAAVCDIWFLFSRHEIDRLHPHGDQTWITEVMRDRITTIPHGRILSYKRHCMQQGEPPLGSIVCFHGRPRLDEVTDDWVSRYWRDG